MFNQYSSEVLGGDQQQQYGLQPPQYQQQQQYGGGGGLQPPQYQQQQGYSPQMQQYSPQYSQQQYSPHSSPPQQYAGQYDNTPNKPDDTYPDGQPSPSYDYQLYPPEDQSGVQVPNAMAYPVRPPGTPIASPHDSRRYSEDSSFKGRAPKEAPRGHGPTKRALLIGINYVGTSKALRGCHNDVKNVFSFLTQTCDFDPDDILTLTDVDELMYLNRSFAQATARSGGAPESSRDASRAAGMPQQLDEAMGLITKLMGKKGGKRLQAAGILKNALLEYMGENSKSSDDCPDESPAEVKKNLQPTRKNILRGIDWLTKGIQSGDTIFFHYSGHGGQVPDEDGDEEDGLDECIFPCDHESAGLIIDDELHDCLVKQVPDGARLVSILDCCHSGTGLDLPYTLEPEVEQQSGHKHSHHTQKLSKLHKQHKKLRKKKSKGKMSKKDKKLYKKYRKQVSKHERGMRDTRSQSPQRGFLKKSEGLSICFSGCEDSQTSADTNLGGQYTGALSFALIKMLQTHPHGLTYAELLYGMRDQMLKTVTMSQIPQLTFNRKDFDVNTAFTL